MYSFGYKMGWLAIHNASREKISSALGLTIIKELGWDEGIDTINSEYEDNIVFVTPAVNDWTFVIGRWAFGTCEEDSVHDIERLITNLSTQFDEVQAFATHHIIEYHHWMLAKNGHLVRSFAYIGESGEVLTNKGELTQIEKSYDWDQLDESEWLPDEEIDEEIDMEELGENEWLPSDKETYEETYDETVMEVVGSWSTNPTILEELSLDEDVGILATDEETDMEEFDEYIRFPSEGAVMKVAGSWSINPSTFEELTLDELGLEEAMGILAYVPKI